MISYYGIRPKTPDEEEEEDQNKQAPKPKLNYKDKLLGEGIDERTISMMEHHMPMDMRTNIGNIQRLEELLIQRGLNQSLVQQPTIPPTNVENQQSDTHNNKLNPNHPEYDEEYATNYLMEMTQFEQEVQNIEVVQCIDTTEETEVDDHNLHDLMEIMDRECQEEEEEEEEEEDNWSYDTPPIADEFIPETMNQHVQMIHETLDKLIINLQKQDSVEAFINILNDDGLLAGVPFSKLIEQVEDDDDDEDYNYWNVEQDASLEEGSTTTLNTPASDSEMLEDEDDDQNGFGIRCQ